MSSISKKTGKTKPGARTVVLAVAALALLLIGLLDLQLSSKLLNHTTGSATTSGTNMVQQKPMLIYQGVVQEGGSYDHPGSSSIPNTEKTETNNHPSAASQNADLEASLHSRPSLAPTTPHARIESKVLPKYPVSALVNHVGGLVVLDVDVNRYGAIEQVQVIEEGNALLCNAAIQAVRLWKFSPATLNGKAVVPMNRVKFTFRPPDNS